MKEKCPFGPLFAMHRKRRAVSLWQLCLNLRYQPRNFQRIENGSQEPRLGLALRMLNVLDMDSGEFLVELAELAGMANTGGTRPTALPSTGNIATTYTLTQTFGALLVQARRLGGHTQQDLADATGFHLRNMTKIENGLQEPRIMTALKLVIATGCGVGPFFRMLVKQTQVDASNDPQPGGTALSRYLL